MLALKRQKRPNGLFSQLDDLMFVDAPKIIAEKKARMYMGRGIEFKHNNPTIHNVWHQFKTLNDFENLMYVSSKLMSECGACFITISKTIDGNALLNLATPYFANGIEVSYGTPDMVVLVEQIAIDNKMNLIRSCYDNEKVIRTMWDADTKAQINMFEFVSKLPKEKQIEWGTYDKKHNAYVVYHNLGVLPVVVLTNYSYRPFFPMRNTLTPYQSPFATTMNFNSLYNGYESIKDTAKCSGLLAQLQNIYTQMNKLMVLDKPRIVINNLNQTTINELRRSNTIANDILSDLVISAGYGSASSPDIKVMSPTNTLDYYQKAIDSTWMDIFNACGLSYAKQSGAQKTAQESTNVFQDSIEMLNYLRNFWTNQWKKVIEISFKTMGIDLGEETEWSFQVRKNIITDEAGLLNNLLLQIQAGISTPVEAIAVIKGIDEDQAQQLWEHNKKWFEDNDFNIAMKGQGMVSGLHGASLPTSKESGGRPTNEESGVEKDV